MNEEEKEAIEELKEELNKPVEVPEDKFNTFILYNIENARIILNLIEKQQKEIKRLKIKNNDLLRKLRNRIKDVKKLQKYGEYKKEFFTLNKRIEKQDKMIKAMAEEIAEFRNELDLINDTKEAVIDEYEEQYIIWRKFFKESR